MKQILIMWSGGLDSSYMLYKYLTETDYPIHAHHIILQNRAEFRWHQEQVAVNNIRDWLKKNCRKFDYSESSYYNRFVGRDIALVLFVASQICYGLCWAGIDEIEVLAGWIVEDNKRAPIKRQSGVFYEGANNIIGTKLTLGYPIKDMTKQDIINKIPKELTDLTWSCRRPIFRGGKAMPCGKCHACKERQCI